MLNALDWLLLWTDKFCYSFYFWTSKNKVELG